MAMKKIAALAGITLLVAGTANAEMPNYNYVQGSYIGGDVEASDLTTSESHLTGYQVDASYAVNDQVLLRGSYLYTERNTIGDWADLQQFYGSVGWITPVSDNTAFDLNIQYGETELKANGVGRAKYKGPGIVFGLRSNVLSWLELYGSGGYLLGDYEGAITFAAGAVGNITDMFAVFVGYEYIDVDDEGNDYKLGQTQLGARVSF